MKLVQFEMFFHRLWCFIKLCFWCVPQLPRSWTSWTGLSLWRGSSLKTVVRILLCAGRCSAVPLESPDTTQVKLFCRKPCWKPQCIHYCQQTLSVSCSLCSHKVESAQQDWPVWCEETPVVSTVSRRRKYSIYSDFDLLVFSGSRQPLLQRASKRVKFKLSQTAPLYCAA